MRPKLNVRHPVELLESRQLLSAPMPAQSNNPCSTPPAQSATSMAPRSGGDSRAQMSDGYGMHEGRSRPADNSGTNFSSGDANASSAPVMHAYVIYSETPQGSQWTEQVIVVEEYPAAGYGATGNPTRARPNSSRGVDPSPSAGHGDNGGDSASPSQANGSPIPEAHPATASGDPVATAAGDRAAVVAAARLARRDIQERNAREAAQPAGDQSASNTVLTATSAPLAPAAASVARGHELLASIAIPGVGIGFDAFPLVAASALKFTAAAPAAIWGMALPTDGASSPDSQALSASGGEIGSTPETAEAAASSLLDVTRSDGMIAFADAMANFAHDSAALGNMVDAAGSHARAWATTAGVLIVDAILITSWHESRRRKGRAAAVNRQLFSMRLITP
jgi:hypothetical protein